MNIKVHQIFYRDSQKPLLDKSFIPYDNAGKSYPFNFEYAVFFDLYSKEKWEGTDYMGTVSWKFKQKTGLDGQAFLNFIEENPGKDIYFVNPFPEFCIYPSVWEQGEEYHPGLIQITANLLKESGYSDNLLKIQTPPNLTAYCNYWVANKKFWDGYIHFLKPIWEQILVANPRIASSLADSADPFIKAPYLPFIFERLFSTYLASHSFTCASLTISDSRLQNNGYLTPAREQIKKVSQLSTHQQVRLLDKLFIKTCLRAHKLRHYTLPLALRSWGLKK